MQMKKNCPPSNTFLKYVRYLDETFRKRVTVALAMTADNVRLIYAVCHQRLVIHFPCDHLRHIGVCFGSRTRLGRKVVGLGCRAQISSDLWQMRRSESDRCGRAVLKATLLSFLPFGNASEG